MSKKQTLLYLSLFLLFYHSSNTVISTFLPIYFQEERLSSTSIGWLMAVGPFTSLLSQPLWGFISDKYKTMKKMMLICSVGVIVTSIILFQVHSFWTLLIVCASFFFFFSPLGAFGDSLALGTSYLVGTSFGRIRMWGSIGFAAMSVLGGQILSVIGISSLLYPFLAFALITFFVCWMIMDIHASAEPINIMGAVHVILSPKFLFFLFFLMFVTITHRTNDIYSGIFIKQLGGNESLIGLSWFVAVTVEAVVLMLSPIWMRFLNEMTYMVIASGLYGIRWMLFSYAETPEQIILLQAMHGITFGILYLCSFQYATNLFEKKFRATGQLFFNSVFFGLSGIIGSLFGGMILDQFDGGVLYRLLSYLSFAGCFGLLLYKSFENKKVLVA